MTLALPWRIVGHTLLLALCLSILVPLLIALGTAFKPANEVYDLQLWPDSPTFANFVRIFTETPFATWAWNSTATTVMRVSGQLFLAVITAFAFARWSFPGREVLFAVVLGAMMIPHQLTMIPIYIMVAELDWFDTWQALVIPNLAMPFGVFLLRQHFLQFPKELFDAAEIDGAGHWRTLWLVVLPNIRPALAALTIILFIETWNEYFWPLLVTDTADSRTIQVGLRQFLEEDFDDYGALMAGITVASLPALAIFFFFQRQVIDTFVASGIKG
ncbi:MAG: carbohydrate ABC transporter permease [Pseudomonadota bacterium]|nr:carbohydrate ABC transporter permease [Pseudomonadota bacterium]